VHRIVAAGLAALGFIAAAGTASAVEVRECGWSANAQFIVEPWEKNARTFYNGQVRVAYLDTFGEPVCCSTLLLIIAPDPGEDALGPLCRVVGDHDEMGFQDIAFDKLTARYDPNKGLLIVFPYSLYVDGIESKHGTAKVRVNLATGTIVAE